MPFLSFPQNVFDAHCAYVRVAVTARFNYIFPPSFLFTSFHPALISSRDDLDLVLGVGSFSLLAQ